MFQRADHPTDQELLGFIDGEASQGAIDRIRKHLAACTDCRSRQLTLEGAAARFAELHHATLDPKLPSAVEPRALLKAQLDAARHSTPKPLLERLSRPTAAYLYAAIAIIALTITALDRRALLSKEPPQVESRLLPDSGLTPGATRPVGLADICPQQHEDEDNDLDPAVSPSIKKVVFQEYGMGDAPPSDYQVDYLINPQLGGTNDVRNLWPEPYQSKVWNARAKDALENRLHTMVCNRQIDLASAQREIATNWIAAYKKYFHKPDPA